MEIWVYVSLPRPFDQAFDTWVRIVLVGGILSGMV